MYAWQLEALYPDVYKNVHEYGNRYCKGVSRIFIWLENLLSVLTILVAIFSDAHCCFL